MGRRCSNPRSALSRQPVSDRTASYKKKGGGGRPLFNGRGSYRFLPPFFFPPLAVFFAIALIPPFTRGIPIARAFPPPSQRHCLLARRPAPVGARRLFANSRGGGRCAAKNWGCQRATPPVVRQSALALLPALFLSALSSLLRHDSSLELGSSADLTTTERYNRWAERTTLIQDVDYG